MTGASHRAALRSAILGAAAALLFSALGAEASSGSGKSGGGKVDDKIEGKIEDQVEEKVEDRADAKIEDKTGDKIDDKVESKAGDKVEQQVDSKVEDRSRDKVEDKVSGGVSGKIEDRVDNSGSGKIEESASLLAADKAAERQAKAMLDRAQKALDAAHKAELQIAKSAFENALASGADKEAAKAEYDAARDASDAAYDAGRDDARAAYETATADDPSEGSGSSGSSGSGGSSGNSGRGGGSSGSGSNSGSSSNNSGPGSGGDRECRDDDDDCDEAAAAAPRFEGEVDENGDVRAKGELLMLAAPREAAALKAAGYETVAIDDLPALGAVLLRVRARGGLKLSDAEKLMRRAAPDAEIDYNHVYATSAPHPKSASSGIAPGALMRIEGAEGARIGVIDSRVDLGHEALAGAGVVAADFVGYEDPRPSEHGTSVVSILAGRSAQFEGVAPGAKVFEASVFFQPATGGASATAASIVRALDWLAAQHVSVVNLSLAGPPNDILKGAIARVQKRGVIVVAAVGNEGPAASPLYPASYPDVVGVTAVGRDKRVFRLAGRGAQVDFAAPGVDILHAGAGGGYRVSSGTSMAAPFVSAAIAAAAARTPPREALPALEREAEDLGTDGRDHVFGWGFIRPLEYPRAADR